MLEKFKVINKNQVIVFVIALMLISVGYLNFTSMNKNVTETSVNAIEYASIGDAKLVSSSNVEEGENKEENEVATIEENIGEAISTDAENIIENTVKEIENTVTNNEVINKEEVQVTSSKELDEYFTSSKLNRQTMYSQMLESYQKILENEQISADQKGIAQTEIKNINDTRNKIMICENLIKIKDIEDVIIFVNDKSVSVVVKAKELKQEQIAQIQNIIAREMSVEISDIHISNKY